MTKDIKRLDLNTPDGAQLNMDALYQIAPSVFTESRDEKTGELKRVVNFDALRQLLGDNAVDENRETYEFRWVGKDEAKAEAARAIDKTLRPVVEDSVDWDTTKNLYIEGDNLEVLKLLQRSYMGKVKMIYIDPPYNTGNDFVYHDDFAMSSDDYDEASGAVDDFGNKYFKNTETSGRFHSDWCNMIYPMLMVARSLLAEDGVIFISIDDNEVENLRKICDEIFGDSNFIAQLTTVMNLKGNNDQFGFAGTHEYALVYAKQINNIELHGIALTKEDYNDYTECDEIGKYKIGATLMRTGEAGARTKRPKGYYPIFVSEDYKSLDINRNSNSDIVVYPKTKDGVEMSWRRSPENLQQTKGDFIIKKTSNGISFYKKQRLEDDIRIGKKPKSLFYKPEYSSGNGTNQLKELFNGRIFDNPKPIQLMQDFVRIGSNKDSIILDFFSGSATTAHAVMQLNAEDGGNRKFIMVQLPELTDEDSEAYKAGYDNICEIGEERIRRAGDMIKEEHPEMADTLDTGFRIFYVDDSNFNRGVKASPGEYNQQQLDLFANNIKADRNDLDLLFGSILAWGLQLDLPMDTEEVDGCKIYTVNDGDLVACFAEKVTEKVIEAMAEKEPLRVLFRDSCFDSDDKKINLFETFKQKLDWTDDEAFNNIRVI